MSETFQIRRNPTTGEVFFWEEGQSDWQPVQARRNPDTNEVFVLPNGGEEWRSLGPQQPRDYGGAALPGDEAPGPERMPQPAAPAVPAQPEAAPSLSAAATRPPMGARADQTDDTRAARGLGRSAYQSGGAEPNLGMDISPIVRALTQSQPDIPAMPAAPQQPAAPAGQSSAIINPQGQALLDAINGRGIGWQQYQDAIGATGSNPTATPAPMDPVQPWSDLLQRAARGATNVPASAVAMGAAREGNPNPSFPGFLEDAQGRLDQRAGQLDFVNNALSTGLSPSGQPLTESEQAELTQERERLMADLRQARVAVGALTPDPPATWGETQSFDAAQDLRDWSESVVGTPDPQFDDRFSSVLAEGGGNMVGFLATGILTGMVGTAAVGATMNAEQLYNEAIELGADEDTARRAARWGAVIGSSEVIPIMHALRPLERHMPGIRNSVARAIVRRVGGSATEEAIQEGAAQVMNNLTAAGIYDPERGFAEGVTESMLVGAILGGAMGAGGAVVAPERQRPPQPGQQDQVTPTPPQDPETDLVRALTGQGQAQPEARPVPEADATPAPPQEQQTPELPQSAPGSSPDERPAIQGQSQADERPAVGAGREPAAGGEDRINPADWAEVPGMDAQGNETGRIFMENRATGEVIPQPEYQRRLGQQAEAEAEQSPETNALQEGGAEPGLTANQPGSAQNVQNVQNAQPAQEPEAAPESQIPDSERTYEAAGAWWDGMSPADRLAWLRSEMPNGRPETQERYSNMPWQDIRDAVRDKITRRAPDAAFQSRDLPSGDLGAAPQPAAGESLEGNEIAAAERGRADFAEGKPRRLPPEIDPTDTVAANAWYQGWDQANLAAPVEVSPAGQPEAGGDTPNASTDPAFQAAQDSGRLEVVDGSAGDRMRSEAQAAVPDGYRLVSIRESNARERNDGLPDYVAEVRTDNVSALEMGRGYGDTPAEAVQAAVTNLQGKQQEQQQEAQPANGTDQPRGPQVVINRVGADGLTDAERGGPMPGSKRARWDGMSREDREALLRRMGGLNKKDGTLTKGGQNAIGKAWDGLSNGARSKIEERWNALDESEVEAEAERQEADQEPAPNEGRSPEQQVADALVDAMNDAPTNSVTTVNPRDVLENSDAAPADQDQVEVEQDADPAQEAEPAATVRLARRIVSMVAAGTPPKSNQALMKLAAEEFGGTIADGAFSPKDAYEAQELAVNLTIQRLAREQDIYDPTAATRNMAEAQVEGLQEMIDALPTQTRRDIETDAFQQFSTPPTYAFVANWVANTPEGSRALEPSAGNGGIAVFAQNAGAKVDVNELSDRRVPSLEALGFDRVTTENAEQIGNIWANDTSRAYDVVVMNPPFSASGTRGGKNTSATGARHIEQALSLLKPGGRLVAIMGHTFRPSNSRVAPFFKRLGKTATLRANVEVNGDKVYKKYGTSYDSRILVIDKIENADGIEPVGGRAESLADLIRMLEDVRDDTHYRSDQDETGAEDGAPADGEGSGAPASDDRPAGGRAQQPERAPEPDDLGSDADRPARPGRPDREDGDATGTGEGGTRPDRQGKSRSDDEGSGTDGSRGAASPDRKRQSVKVRDAEQSNVEETAGGFAKYRPTRVRIDGATEHPMLLVESSAMASVNPPRPNYEMQVPAAMVKKGLLSEAQLEQVLYAGAAHAEMLPAEGDKPAKRRGFMIGDGTGVGKTREIAGIIADNWAQGRKRSILVSKDKKLFEGARSEFDKVGMKSVPVGNISKVKPDASIAKGTNGVMFMTYATLARTPQVGQKSRIEQLVEWVGTDFDGAIIFDESHIAGNAIPIKGKRGTTKPSNTALSVVDLQNALPNARVVYASATAATEVHNLGYADRLGLWGPGTPFPSVLNFVSQIESGGIAAMEVVARDMKQMGAYMARTLSFDGVEYEKVEHTLSPAQSQMYNAAAQSWQSILSNIDQVVNDHTDGGGKQRGAALSQFWGAHQRFFQQVLTSMQMPTIIKSIRADLKSGMAPVVQIVNTNEAATKRAVGRMEEGDTFEDIDITPRDALIQYLETSFPVHQFEEYTDDDGRVRTRPVKDSNGDFVVNAEAVRIRDDLVAEMASMTLPGNPLDMLIDEFGADNVAEVTGRSTRIVTRDGKKKSERRSQNKTMAEARDFQNGKRDVLIFSDAGGTGMDFHADLSAKNQKRRAHYVLQAGWRADRAIQGFGRTHRTNQASAPVYKLAGTNLSGHKRFTSSIARRLDQLGALTKGQKDASGSGMFSAADNLENEFAENAVMALFKEIYARDLDWITPADVERELGLNLVGEKGFNVSKVPPVPQFLNRLLNTTIDRQNQLFERFMDHMEDAVQFAIDNGEFTAGVEELRHDGAQLVETQEAYRNPENNATSEYRVLNVRNRTEVTPFKDINAYASVRYKKHSETGVVYAFRPASSRTNDRGEVIPTYHRHSPTHRQIIDSTNYRFDYETVQADEAEKAWADQIADAPPFSERSVHLVTGALLPIWDRLPRSNPKIIRVTTDDGRSFLGREIPDVELMRTLEALGVNGPNIDMNAEQMIAAAMSGKTIMLSSGHRIVRRKVGGEQRVEIVPEDKTRYEDTRPGGTFDRLGFQIERINYKARGFIPNSEAGQKALADFMRGKRIANVLTEKNQASDGDSARWRQQVMSLFRGETIADDMDMGPVPAVIRRLGGHGRRMVIQAGKAKTISRKHSDLTEAAWLNLPQMIADPELVIENSQAERSGDLLVVTSEQVSDGRHVVVAVRSDGTTADRRQATVVVTFFPKNRLAETIRGAARQGRVKYARVRRAGEGYEGIRANSGSATPAGDAIPHLRNSDILTHDDVFKSRQRVGQSSPTPYGPMSEMGPVFKGLRQSLDALGLKNVELRLDPQFAHQGKVYADHFGKIAITIGQTLNPRWTVGHEAIHVYKHMGVFTSQEWGLLAETAESEWIERYGIEDRYPDLTRDEMVEEAVAEAFGEVFERRDRNFAPRPVMNALRKIANFLKAIQNWARGFGFQTPGDILHAMARGEMATKAERARRPEGWISQTDRLLKQQRKPGMIQENGGRLHLPERKVWDSLLNRNLKLRDRIREGRGATRDRFDVARTRVQDRVLVFKRAQDVVVAANGGKPLPEELNAYLAEEMYSGRSGFKLDKIDQDFTSKIIDIIAKTPGMTEETVGTYLYARHAEERNERIAEINPDMPDGGSGMATGEATAILSEIHNGEHAKEYRQIGSMIDKLRDQSIQERVDMGLMTEFEAKAWREAYRHYVPLKGWAETDYSDAQLDVTGIGRGYNVRGDETKRAMGRSTEAFNPLIAAITQAQEVVIRAEKNRVGQHLYRLAKDVPSKDLWTVKRAETRRVFNETTGIVEERSFSPITLLQASNELAVKVDGQEHRIIFHDHRLARAATRVGTDNLGGMMIYLSKFSRYFSAINTMLNPVFVVKNFVRDTVTANINVHRFPDAGKIQREMMRNVGKAMRGAHRGLGGKADTEWSQYFQEFSEAGGKVSFWTIENPEAGQAKIRRRIWRKSSVRGMALSLVTPTTEANPILAAVERVNLAVDNAVRLSAFVSARKNGYTIQEAASLSKNLTVNFNRRGEWGSAINALYTFSNAGLQGTHMLLKSMQSRKVQAITAGMVALFYLLDQANAYLSDEDEDGQLYYDKIPEFYHEMNAILMLGASADSADTSVRLFLPYGYNIFAYAGNRLSRVQRGVTSPTEAFGDTARVAFSSFSPINGQDFLTLLSPTLMDPVAEIASNQTFTGSPIYPRWRDPGLPDAYYHGTGATGLSVAIAQAVNQWTGGNYAESGYVDVSPETIDHVSGFFLGGMGRTMGRSFNLMSMIAAGEDVQSSDIPLARQVYVPPEDWWNSNLYWDRREEIYQAHRQALRYEANGDPVPSHIQWRADLHRNGPRLEAERLYEGRSGQSVDRDAAYQTLNSAYVRAWMRNTPYSSESIFD